MQSKIKRLHVYDIFKIIIVFRKLNTSDASFSLIAFSTNRVKANVYPKSITRNTDRTDIRTTIKIYVESTDGLKKEILSTTKGS